jgi:hypothetical protein
MGLLRKFLGPKSKYDKSLPYTYMAKEAIIEGDDDLFSYYYADTLCGLVEYLDKEGIFPNDVEIFGLYRGEEKKLDKNIFLDRYKRWLFRPEICRALEEYFERTKDRLYKGHKELEVCAFDDRDREGEGP